MSDLNGNRRRQPSKNHEDSDIILAPLCPCSAAEKLRENSITSREKKLIDDYFVILIASLNVAAATEDGKFNGGERKNCHGLIISRDDARKSMRLR